MKDEEKLKDFLKSIISQAQTTPETHDRIGFREFYTANARADLAKDILDILEHGFHEPDYKVRCGNKVFNAITRTFEEE